MELLEKYGFSHFRSHVDASKVPPFGPFYRETMKEWMEENVFYLVFIPAITVSLLIIRHFFEKIVYKRFPKSLSYPGMKDGVKRNVVQSLFYVSCLAMSYTFGEYATRNESWRISSNAHQCFEGYPYNVLSTEEKLYYAYYLAFYFYQLCQHFFDEKKKDFWPMLIHHIVTITVVGVSLTDGFHRMGTFVMLSFDLCDIFLELAKISHRIKHPNFAASFYVLFVSWWSYHRIYVFTRYAVPAVFNVDIISGYHVKNLVLYKLTTSVLWLLQVYWTTFIIKKTLILFKKGVTAGDDPREKEE